MFSSLISSPVYVQHLPAPRSQMLFTTLELSQSCWDETVQDKIPTDLRKYQSLFLSPLVFLLPRSLTTNTKSAPETLKLSKSLFTLQYHPPPVPVTALTQNQLITAHFPLLSSLSPLVDKSCLQSSLCQFSYNLSLRTVFPNPVPGGTPKLRVFFVSLIKHTW